MANWLQDLGYAFRRLRKSPGFAITAVLTLAVAIGANAVVFAALNGLVLRPLNVRQPESLFEVSRPGLGSESYPNYLDLRDRNHTFEALAASSFDQAGLDTGDGAMRVWGFETSGNYFDVLGVQPYLGRVFHASDEHGPNSAPYIVISYSYWQNHFHSNRAIVGRAVLLNKHPVTIIGVAQPGFRSTFVAFPGDFFVPIGNQGETTGSSQLTNRANRWLDEIFGHLKPGVTPAQAVADLNSIGAGLEKNYPKENGQMTFSLSRPGFADVFNGAIKAFLSALMCLAGLILLAACANLGSLFAARAADRSKEVALRLALGSTRRRVLGGLFIEAVMVSLIGGMVGLWAGVVLLHALSNWQPFPEFPINVPVAPDANVYLVALFLSLASGFLFGMVPVRQVLRTDPYQTIKLGTGGNGARRFTARDLLLAAQIAICALLVTSSLVAVRGLGRSLDTKLGVDPNNATLVLTDPTQAGYADDEIAAVQKRMIEAMQRIPGVTSAALVSTPPLHMGWDAENVFRDTTADLKPANAAANAIKYSISPEYFQSAGTALLSGRNFTWHDDKNSPRVAVVNQEFARKLFGSASGSLGRYYKSSDGMRVQVVGIVEDGKYTANIAESPQPAVFLPIRQSPTNQSWMIVRSQRDPQYLSTAIRGALLQVDAGLPSFIQTWNTEMNGALFASRIAAMALGVLGIMGAILSITGIFGMAAYSVSKRLRELGIRVALGAQKKEVLIAALGRAFRLLIFGSSVGLALGIVASRVLSYIVYEATPRDPVVLTGVVAAMALLGLVATWLPARRALSVDPVILLRDE
jgi:predicted permease